MSAPMTEISLVLEDGSVFEGEAIGHIPENGIAAGEVVFNTALTGYQEVITDPRMRVRSLRSPPLILVTTAPLLRMLNHEEHSRAVSSCATWLGVEAIGEAKLTSMIY